LKDRRKTGRFLGASQFFPGKIVQEN